MIFRFPYSPAEVPMVFLSEPTVERFRVLIKYMYKDGEDDNGYFQMWRVEEIRRTFTRRYAQWVANEAQDRMDCVARVEEIALEEFMPLHKWSVDKLRRLARRARLAAVRS